MYFKKLTNFNSDMLSEYTDLDEDYHFIMNILVNIIVHAILLTFCIGCIILIPIALFDHFLVGINKLYKYIKYGNLKKAREKKVRAIIKEHGNKLLLVDNEYFLKHSVDEGSLINFNTSLRYFIFAFFWQNNAVYNTYNKDNKLICDTNRRRSLGDIFLICKNYYPECTIEEVLTILIKLLNEKDLYASYCSTINKYVFHNQNDNWIKDSKTEYGDVRFNELVEIYK